MRKGTIRGGNTCQYKKTQYEHLSLNSFSAGKEHLGAWSRAIQKMVFFCKQRILTKMETFRPKCFIFNTRNIIVSIQILMLINLFTALPCSSKPRTGKQRRRGESNSLCPIWFTMSSKNLYARTHNEGREKHSCIINFNFNRYELHFICFK